MKKGAVGIIILVLIIATIVFIPVIMYGGFNVDLLSGTLSLESSTDTVYQSNGLMALSPSINNWDLDLQNETKNSWAYAVDGIGGRNKVEDEENEISLSLTISIVIKKDNETVKEIYLGVLHGEGYHNVTVEFGPGEGLDEEGYYDIYIKVTLKLKTPGVDLNLNIELGPMTFYLDINKNA